MKNFMRGRLHFDEKWLNNKYISKYVKIEPSEDELLNFIENITKINNIVLIKLKESPISLRIFHHKAISL